MVFLCVAILVVLLAAGSIVWSERKTIAVSYADRVLSEAGVVGRYHIEQLGVGRQRVTDVVIGDPANPDLSIDWIELQTRIGWTGPKLAAVRAGRVRLAARYANGTLSLGKVDRLLPKEKQGAAQLPDLALAVDDLVMSIATPAGRIALHGTGRGNLANGFVGRFAVTSAELIAGPCAAHPFAAQLDLTTHSGKASIAGPALLRTINCGEVTVTGARATLAATVSTGFDRATGQLSLRVDKLVTPGLQAKNIAGMIGFSEALASPQGQLHFRAETADARGVAARGASVEGRYALSVPASHFRGRIGIERAVATGLDRQWPSADNRAATNPVAELLGAIRRSIERAGRGFGGSANLLASADDGGLSAQLSALNLRSDSGARLSARGDGLRYDQRGLRVDARIDVAGGGLPTLQATVAGTPSSNLTGRVALAPYRAGASTIAATPINVGWRNGDISFATALTLSGPIGDGWVERLRVPLVGSLTKSGALIVGRDCAIARFDRVVTSGLGLEATQVTLCPVGGAMFSLANGRTSGGLRIEKPSLAGRLGDAPLTFTADKVSLLLGTMQFRLAGGAVRLGTSDRLTRLDIAEIGGTATSDGFSGRFDKAAGQIANVPLRITDASGDWRLVGNRLSLTGETVVGDTAPTPRFKPLRAGQVGLTLDGGVISVSGALIEPRHNVVIADVRITHRLASGDGNAQFDVPGIAFGKGFQPDDLTPLTFGVIADVKGTVEGAGRIDWSSGAVTSGGSFRTDGIDLAAAIGPVTGISGAIRFTDLLDLESAPGQQVRIATINPGVPVTDGVLRIQTLSGARIQIEDGVWPFAGGTLQLRPTLLDFSRPIERRTTFDVAGVDAGQFLQQFDFKNLNATGTFDGTLPMIFDADGGRIEGGHLTVRSAQGGTISYVGEVSQEDLGFWGNFAFQALKSLRYRTLDIVMNGPLSGEMITEVRFAGIGQGAGARRNFVIDRLQKLPLVFNVQIRAPFRQLVDSAQSFYDPRRLIERNLPALLDQQKQAKHPEPVQPR